MEHERLTESVLRDLALGREPAHVRLQCLAAEPTTGATAATLAALAAFWDGDFGTAHHDATRAVRIATPGQHRLALAALALTLAGDVTTADELDPTFDELLATMSSVDDPREEALTRYLSAEAALACARVDDANTLLQGPGAPARAWTGHPFAVVMQAASIRAAAFAAHISRALEMLPELREHAAVTGERLANLARAVEMFVGGNAAEGTVTGVAVPPDPVVDYLDRGACLLAAYGSIAVGDAATAAGLVLRAGGDAGLERTPIIDRALGLELLAVAALADGDLDAALAWEGQAALIAEHPTARPTIDRLRSRIALAAGDAAEAVALAERSVEACRAQGRLVECAESEVVLARANIADQHVSTAARRLRALVVESDAAGHAAVRLAASRTLGAANRRLPPLAHGGWGALSERESEVGRLVLQGHDLGQIARTLYLSPHTVRGHVSRVLGAFGVATRVGLLEAVGADVVDARADALPELTARQTDVVARLARGAANQVIADDLGISVKAVEKHVGDAMRRWEVSSRFELARLWRSRSVAAP